MSDLVKVIVDTHGATAPEFVTAALARHPTVTMLPGLAFVREGLRLYRPHQLQGLDGARTFDRLWAPSFEPNGRMWAGVTRHMTASSIAALDLATARQDFIATWQPDAPYIDTLFAFAAAVAPVVGAWKPSTTHLGFCGPPCLMTVDWDDLKRAEVRVVVAQTTLPIWLALISQRSIVNCLDALRYWLVHAVVRAAAVRAGVALFVSDSLRYTRVPGLEAPLRDFLDLPEAALLPPQPGHLNFNATVFAETQMLADALDRMFAGDPTYDAATRVETYADTLAADPMMAKLLDRYITYWRSTAHLHFDTVGPLQIEIADRALAALGVAGLRDPRSATQRFAQAFFHEFIAFRSYSFETPEFTIDTYLGVLEESVDLPVAPYFVHAALCYLEHCLDRQKKWLDSYLSLKESRLYQMCRSPAFARLITTHDFAARLARLEALDAETAVKAVTRTTPTSLDRDGSARLL